MMPNLSIVLEGKVPGATVLHLSTPVRACTQKNRPLPLRICEVQGEPRRLVLKVCCPFLISLVQAQSGPCGSGEHLVCEPPTAVHASSTVL